MPTDEVGDLLAGAGEPRPVPESVRARLAAALLSDAELSSSPGADVPVHGIDAPRPLPAAVRQQVVGALVASRGGRRRFDAVRILAIAAVFVLLAGIAAAATRPVDSMGGLLALPPDRPPVLLPGKPTTTTTTPSTTTTEPTFVAMDESSPAYAALESFGSCDELLTWVRAAAMEEVGPYGLPYNTVSDMPTVGTPAPDGQPQPQQQASGRLPGTVSSTNVQEAGVDEPDLLKVDDRALFILTSEALHAVGHGGGPQLLSSTQIASPEVRPHSLLLDNHIAVVLVDRIGGEGLDAAARFIDMRDPAHPVELGSELIPGHIVDARLSNGTLFVVSTWSPVGLDWTYPSQDISSEQATAANRDLIARSELDHWVPPGVACEGVRHPAAGAGVATTIINAISVDRSTETRTEALLADAGTVYATADRLVVATMRWTFREDGFSNPARTHLHLFALQSEGPSYLASGSVPGYIHSEYSLDADSGYLRVASTDTPNWMLGESRADMASSITILEPQGSELVPVGSLGGIGRGETIQGIRFVDDIAFVVTFLFTDPLFTIDLSDPTRPRLRGELVVPGFSGYLHPLGAGAILGIGVEGSGGAVSIYDVGDLDNPTLAQRVTDANATYQATREPHAFLLSEPLGLVVLPTNGVYDDSTGVYARHSAFDVYSLTGGLAFRARITHDAHSQFPELVQPERAAMVNGVLYTVSNAGVLATDPGSFTEIGFAPLPLG